MTYKISIPTEECSRTGNIMRTFCDNYDYDKIIKCSRVSTRRRTK